MTDSLPANAPDPRLITFGAQLRAIHDWMRTELDRIRDHLDDPDTEAPPFDLRRNCLTFCTALTAHHTAEDDTLFPQLARDLPSLQPMLTKMTQDHHMVSGIILRIETLVADAGSADHARLLGELDGLAAILESHFSFEERQLATLLEVG